MTDSQGLMNIGKHCAYCRQLDFLPFTCADCGSIYCADHRTPTAHNCSGDILKLNQLQSQKPELVVSGSSTTSHGRTAAQLFAEAKEPKSYEANRLGSSSKPGTLQELLKSTNKSTNVGGGLAALEKVRKFVKLQRKSLAAMGSKKSPFAGGASTFKSFFKSSPTERIVSLSRLKSSAKGDAKVPAGERVYAWLIIVPDNSSFTDYFAKDKSHLKQDFQKPVYVSRNWPVGRALDSFAQQYKIKNDNNKINDKKLRLALFRLARSDDANEKAKLQDEKELVMPIAANGRVNKEIKDGDTLYLVRGAEA